MPKSTSISSISTAAARALLAAAALSMSGCGQLESGWWIGTPLEPAVIAYLASVSGAVGPDETGREAFERRVHPILRANCDGCHAGQGPGTPAVALANSDDAYDVVVSTQKVDLGAPEASRLVRRLSADFHYCWTDCGNDAAVMQQAIEAWALAELSADDTDATAVAIIESGTLQWADGIEDTDSGRHEEGAIALWHFKEGGGDIAYDLSGVSPALNLELSGNAAFMGSYGVAFDDGRALADANSSRKLYDQIAHPFTGSQQYTVEAWVTPADVTQEGPARIVSYSSGGSNRNFTLGQVLYNYDYRLRQVDPEVDSNGRPSLRTADADQDLQATLQHVVMTYDGYRGRRIYVNGIFTDDHDETRASRLWNWDPSYRFVLGSETTGSRHWTGNVRLAAVYPFVLAEEHITQNFLAGVGRKLRLRFDLSEWMTAGSILEFEVTELDEYSYLFCSPRLFTDGPTGFRVSNLRVSVNGRPPVTGQAFVHADRVVSQSGQVLSDSCSIVPKELGTGLDVFSIEFERLASFRGVVIPIATVPLPRPDSGEPMPGDGMRSFERAHETMAAVTRVSPTAPGVGDTFDELRQALPATSDLRTFSASQQIAVSKLSLEYCDAMVDTPALRDAFFGNAVDFGLDATQAFGPASRPGLADVFADNMLGISVAHQPSAAELQPILDELLDALLVGCTPATCGTDRTRTFAKATCAAVLASAAVSVH